MDDHKFAEWLERQPQQAFPMRGKLPSGGDYFFPGMTLRDWFAGQALAALAQNDSCYVPASVHASRAYVYADAMIKARGQ